MNLLLNKYAKILYSDNAVFTDYSSQMRSWTADTMGAVLTVNEDYIYIGCPHTFTARFILMDGSNVNSETASMTVEYYYGSSNWRAVKNLTDETRSGTATLAQSGFISWDLPTDWVKSQVNSQPELPYGVSAGDNQGYYWARIKASATLTAGTAIKWLGLIWTSQAYMKIKWPECDDAQYLPTGKTDWYELIEMSTGDVADDLNLIDVIEYELQAKDINEFAKLTALKTLINILIPMVSSETLSKMKSDFEAEYKKLLGKKFKSIDSNQDGKLNDSEKKGIQTSRILRA